MKENYVYSAGKVISTEKASGVSENYDEDAVVGDDRIVIRDYQDNIEEIFIVENLIEDLQKSEIEKILKSSEKSKKIQNKNNIYLSIFSSVLLLPWSLYYFNTSIAISTLIWLISSTVLISGTYFYEKRKKEKVKNELAGIDLELKEIRKEVLKNKEQLANLRKNKTRNNEEIIKGEKVVKVNYIDKLKELRDYLKLIYNIGYSESKLQNHYDQGTLQEQLHDEYSEKEIELVKKYFDNKKTTI